MIKIENVEVVGWEHAIRGMRNPKNSWDRSDSIYLPYQYCDEEGDFELSKMCGGVAPIIKENDHKLMMNLAKGGPVHAKYRRMIVVYVDITAPLYWWKEFDTYKVGTVANSCSTMHKIHDKEFTWTDFSAEHLLHSGVDHNCVIEDHNDIEYDPQDMLYNTIEMLNRCRDLFLQTKDKKYWWQMIQLLPSSYNQKRTVMLNYEVLAGIYPMRKDHKLDEWHVFCDWINNLPYSEIIIGEKEPEFLTKHFSIPREEKKLPNYNICPECGGAGVIEVVNHVGKYVNDKCPTCNGEKVIRVNPEVEE